MCLYPTMIKNRKYTPTVKNGGVVPVIKDIRTAYVAIGCQKCMECRKQKQREWQVRLQEEIRADKRGKFVTMTFSDESLNKIQRKVEKKRKKAWKELEVMIGKKKKYTPLTGYELDNEIATYAVRKFLERWRSKHKTSVKHWLVTELGQTNTERLHIHGIIWTDKSQDEVTKRWKYGNVNKMEQNWSINYCTERTVNYIVKYISKPDQLHKEYNPKILTSAGIGKKYIERPDSKLNKFNGEKTDEMYRTRQGLKLPLPIYYRNKIYTEEQKEQLWIQLLDKEKRYINGIEVDVSQNEDDYYAVLKEQRSINKRLGYGTNELKWNRKVYEESRRNIKMIARLRKERNSEKTPTRTDITVSQDIKDTWK